MTTQFARGSKILCTDGATTRQVVVLRPVAVSEGETPLGYLVSDGRSVFVAERWRLRAQSRARPAVEEPPVTPGADAGSDPA